MKLKGKKSNHLSSCLKTYIFEAQISASLPRQRSSKMRLLLLIGVVALHVTFISCDVGLDTDKHSRTTGIEVPSWSSLTDYPSDAEIQKAYKLLRQRIQVFTRLGFRALFLSDPPNVTSMISMYIPLSILSFGNQGRYRTTFFRRLMVQEIHAEMRKYAFVKLMEALPRANFRIATQIYYNEETILDPKWVDLAEKVFKVKLDAFSPPFSNSHLERLNAWVANQTDHKITPIFEVPPLIELNSTMLVVSVVHFNGRLQSPFDRSLTTDRPFHKSNGEIVSIPTMHKRGRMLYGRMYSATFVKLNYQIVEGFVPISLIIILPDDPAREYKFLEYFRSYFSEPLTSHEMDVDLYLPKFICESFVNVSKSLQNEFNRGNNPLRRREKFVNVVEPSQTLPNAEVFVKYVIEINEGDGGHAVSTVSVLGILISYVTIITCATYNGNSKVNYSINGFELVTGVARNFSLNFFQKLTLLDINSRALSPLSFFIPLSMLMYGSRGTNRQNYMKVLGLRKDETNIARRGYKRLIDTLSLYNLRIATKMYYPPDLMPDIFYIHFAMKVFNAEIEPIDTDPHYVRAKEINEWLSSRTDGQCTELFKEPLKSGSNSGVLIVTALYFKGTWQSPFDRSRTMERPFYAFKQVFYVPTMYQFDRLPYGRIDSIGASFLELPYKSAGSDDAMSMFVLLPDDSRQLNRMILELRQLDLKELLTGLPIDVHLYLPKFKLESSVRMGRLFNYIFGQENPFKKLINFSGLSASRKPMAFGDSIVKYVIEVDEVGDTAVGSTGTYYTDKIHQRLRRSLQFNDTTRVIEFNVNRPFLAIIATKGKVVLDIFTINFTGREFMPGIRKSI